MKINLIECFFEHILSLISCPHSWQGDMFSETLRLLNHHLAIQIMSIRGVQKNHVYIFQTICILFPASIDSAPTFLLFKATKNPPPFLTNPKSKSKVKVRADDWVFIKIRFSNHPASHLATQPPPASHPPGKVSKKQDRAILPK